MHADQTGRLFSFGVFEADEARTELRRHGMRIKLHSQPFQVLMMLLEKPSAVVTREEMRQRLWGEDTFVNFDHSLNTSINKIREALGDSASRPRYVETVSGKGYRFIAPVSECSRLVAQQANACNETSAGADSASGWALSTVDELPAISREKVRLLLLLTQVLYLGCYVGALANLREIDGIFIEAKLFSPGVLVNILVTTAVALIPVRLFLVTAVAFDLRELPSKFSRMFPGLLLADLLWALSPFLLVHHVNIGLALGMTAALVYLPFAQRSLVLMFGRS